MNLRIAILCSTLLAVAPLTAADTGNPPRVLAAGTLELHGTWDGQRFWARLLPRDQQYGNKRVLQLVYTQPTAKELGGTILVDHPYILLDDHLRVVAWNERTNGLSNALFTAAGKDSGYQVRQGHVVGTGTQAVEKVRAKKIDSALAWDQRLAPLLLALSWRGATEDSAVAAVMTEVPAVDLFHHTATEVKAVNWGGKRVVIAGTTYRAEADQQGRLAALRPLDEAGEPGAPLLVVSGWLKDGAATKDVP